VDNGGANSFGNMISRNRQPQSPTLRFAHGIVGGYFFTCLMGILIGSVFWFCGIGVHVKPIFWLRKKFSHFQRRSITANFPEGHLWSSSLNYVVQFGTIKQHCVDNGGANSFGNMISRNRQPQSPTLRFAHGIVGGYFFYMFNRHFDGLSILILRNWCSRQARFFTFDITLSTQNRVAHTVWKISPYRGRLNYVHFGMGFLVTAGIWIGSVFWFCGIGVHFKLNLLISALRWA